ncbi:MAG: hypothetical protein EOL93_07315 [Epsilonproteobacteria bacterium]|nr:hypothetical protein [Campylobacterota bacterium]
MKKSLLKKRYLLQNPKEAVRTFATAFPSYERLFLGLYLENGSHAINPLGVLSVRFENSQELSLFERVCQASILKEVSEDRRYKNRFLALFGLPERYDFSLEEVFKRCDALTMHPFQCALRGGMSSQKVLKVLLYQQMKSLENAILALLDDEAKAPKRLSLCAHRSIALLKLGAPLFDASLCESLIEKLSLFTCKERIFLLQFVHTEVYATFKMDMDFFLREQSGFYLLEKSEMPLLFLLKKKHKKGSALVAKRLRKALI